MKIKRSDKLKHIRLEVHCTQHLVFLYRVSFIQVILVAFNLYQIIGGTLHLLLILTNILWDLSKMRGNAVILTKRSIVKYMCWRRIPLTCVQPNIQHLNLPAKCKPPACKVNFKRSDRKQTDSRQKVRHFKTPGPFSTVCVLNKLFYFFPNSIKASEMLVQCDPKRL